MLQDIRDNAQGTIAKIIIAVLIVSLSIWGMDAIVGGFRGEAEVATVNGEDITEQEYLRTVQIASQRQLSQMDNPDPTLLDEDQIRREVLEHMIQAEVLAQDAASQGLELTDEGVDQLIVSLPQFQVNGQFNQQVFTSQVRNLGMGVGEYRQLLKREYISNQISTAVIRSGLAPVEAARQLLALEAQTRDFRTLTLEAASVADQLEITDADVEQWYNDNQQLFTRPESVDVSWIELSLDKVAAGIEVPEEAVRERYDALVAEQHQGEWRTAHILIEDGEGADQRIETVRQRLEEGADFADLAREFSDDPLSADQGGDLGYLREGALGGAYDEAMLALEEGEVSEPVETEYGTHFIKLLGTRTAEPPAFETMADEIRQELARARAGDEFARQRTELADRAFSSESLEEPADQFGLEISQRDGVTRDSNQAPFDHAGLVRQLFSKDVMEDGFNTELIEVNANTAVVARVRAHHPQAPQPLEEVASQVRDRLEREQTLALLQEQADEILQKLRDGDMTPQGDDWTVHNGVVRSEAQVPPAVQARAFSMPTPADDSFTYGSVAADTDLVIIALSAVADGDVDTESDDVRGMAQFLAQINGQREYDAYVRTLREKAEIVRP